RLQPEQGAAVVDQVELDVAAAPIGLEVALPLAVGGVAVPLDDRRVGLEEGVADRARHRVRGVETRLVQVVEEHAAHAAGLAPMPKVEVLVAPLLEARMPVRAEGLERLLADTVKADHVLLE